MKCIGGKGILIVNLITYKNLFLETFFNGSEIEPALFSFFPLPRPLCIVQLPEWSKILEKLFHNQLQGFLEVNDILHL